MTETFCRRQLLDPWSFLMESFLEMTFFFDFVTGFVKEQSRICVSYIVVFVLGHHADVDHFKLALTAVSLVSVVK